MLSYISRTQQRRMLAIKSFSLLLQIFLRFHIATTHGAGSYSCDRIGRSVDLQICALYLLSQGGFVLQKFRPNIKGDGMRLHALNSAKVVSMGLGVDEARDSLESGLRGCTHKVTALRAVFTVTLHCKSCLLKVSACFSTSRPTCKLSRQSILCPDECLIQVLTLA
jgi:hypothetical protein